MSGTKQLMLWFFGFLLVVVSPALEVSEFERLPLWPADGKLTVSHRDRYVFRDASTHEIVIAFPKDREDPSAPRTVYRWRPQNQVAPRLTPQISRATDLRFEYRYTLANRSEARQSIAAWCLLVAGPGSDIEVEHPKWGKVRLPGTSLKQVAHPSAPTGDAAYWSSRVSPDLNIPPGQSASEFVVRSSYLPGFTTAYVQGGEPLSTPGQLPHAVMEQLIPLMRPEQKNGVVTTLGPRFAPGTDHQIIAADYEKGLHFLFERGLVSNETVFYQKVMSVLAVCAASGTKPCTAEKQDEILAEASTPLEKEIGSALVMAFQ